MYRETDTGSGYMSWNIGPSERLADCGHNDGGFYHFNGPRDQVFANWAGDDQELYHTGGDPVLGTPTLTGRYLEFDEFDDGQRVAPV